MARKVSDNVAYGSHHKKQREAMLYRLKDGTECEYCAEPLYKRPEDNFDGAPLELDHEEADTSRLGSRLLHRRCNRSIITKWVKHGPGWMKKYGYKSDDISPPGGTTTAWPTF